ncbi:tyrosine-type recombinase/integrase [Streptomyces termitum]|uniref:tyrosine-type recombinase/integrase n=1 Tax=Streptomyces termitum TaxID=67368 RepID=UPI0016779C66|nr:tyrosine-type recombinase/integrase [Streptomyces termitum]
MSAELFHVISQVIRRHRGTYGTVPIATRYDVHDFRRPFATDLVDSGLPIHIGAALLGHLNIQTTRGCVAVFDDDIVRHYQQFLDQRRQLRPEEEYRDPASEERSKSGSHEPEDVAVVFAPARVTDEPSRRSANGTGLP